MIKLEQRQQKIIRIFLEKGKISSSVVHAELQKNGENISLPTTKRDLSELVNEGVLNLIGAGRSTSYEISVKGRVFSDIDAKEYCSVEPDNRYGLRGYNFDLLRLVPADIFVADEMKKFEDATSEYKKRTEDISQTIQKKELERLVIELSWKSSKIEGNTYTLLDTEKLILENKEAPGHSKDEARMILNHKDAFYYVRENKEQFKTITRKNLEELHAILMKDLNVSLGLRATLVGITGSVYRPLDNIYQITEAVESLTIAVARMQTPYAKALLALLGIGYIQPFEDGNKRTGRLMANALLLAHSLAPLSYRGVDENDYRESMLSFYELNSIVPMKNIFVGQYEFAARNYAVK